MKKKMIPKIALGYRKFVCSRPHEGWREGDSKAQRCKSYIFKREKFAFSELTILLMGYLYEVWPKAFAIKSECTPCEIQTEVLRFFGACAFYDHIWITYVISLSHWYRLLKKKMRFEETGGHE
jgi:hypothetical protein